MTNKSQALMFSLWILAILVVLTVSIGHRVSIGLRLVSYQKNRLSAYCAAKTGLQMGIIELEAHKDDVYNSLDQTWNTGIDSTGKNVFKDIELPAGAKTVFSINIIDEQSKININTASSILLANLILDTGLAANSLEIANNICAWRGDKDIGDTDYKDFGYDCKGNKFNNIYELLLVKGVTTEIFRAIQDLITAWPSDNATININTASEGVLGALINTAFDDLKNKGVQVENPTGLLTAIITFRKTNNGYFADPLDLTNLGLTDGQKNIITSETDGLANKVGVKSDTFRIYCTGTNIASRPQCYIDCVFNRKGSKTLYWHQN